MTETLSDGRPSKIPPPSAQRLDQWLHRARFFKTRAVAAREIKSSAIRVMRHAQSQRVLKPSFLIQPGDIVSFAKGSQLFSIEILAPAKRRGPYAEAKTLYVDHSPPQEKKEKPLTDFTRAAGAGRPTKKDRRALDKLRNE